MSTPRVWFRAMVFAIAGMILVFFGIGFLLDDDWSVVTTRDLAAPSASVAALVSDLSTWSSWSSMDATLGAQTARTVQGNAGEAGHALEWSGSQGRARLTLRTVTPDAVEYDFLGQGPDGADFPWRSTGRIEWRDVDGRCRVRWWEQIHWDTLTGRWFGWFGAVQLRAQQIQASSLEGLANALAPDARQDK